MCYNDMYALKIPCLGAIVISKAGHDKGRAYIVTKVVSDEFVFCCDGEYRKVANPKRKRFKHLLPIGFSKEVASSVVEKKLTDYLLKKELKNAQRR